MRLNAKRLRLYKVLNLGLKRDVFGKNYKKYNDKVEKE